MCSTCMSEKTVLRYRRKIKFTETEKKVSTSFTGCFDSLYAAVYVPDVIFFPYYPIFAKKCLEVATALHHHSCDAPLSAGEWRAAAELPLLAEHESILMLNIEVQR